MTRQEIQAVIDKIRYKRGWSVGVREDFDITARGTADPHVRPYLQVVYDGSGEYGAEPWTGRKWMLSEHMTETEIVHTGFKAILAAEEHETRELFLWEGVAVCGPHYAVRDIVDLVRSKRLHHDVRTDAMQGAT